MADISTLGIIGIDNFVPVYQPEGRWCFWELKEIWDGIYGSVDGAGIIPRYVPKVRDYVMDADNYVTYRVEHLDAVTLIPRLKEIRPANMSFSLTETDVLFGVGPGTQSDTYRVYLDTSVLPHVLAVDIRLKVAGTMASYAKIFRGTDLSATGQIVSRLYDASGNFLTHNIPLELVAIDSHVNYSIKTISVCYTNETLVDGEIVTAVIYDDAGHVVSKRQLLVENTSFIRSVNASLKYISHIGLECPFQSPTFDHVIEFPLNVPTNALNLIGVVNYSDGSVLKLPVDGTKFRMYGIDQYVSTIIGQEIELVLSYALSPGEVVYGAVTGDGKYVTEPYKIVSVEPNNAYTVKLYVYPQWIDDANGYKLRWFMMNLDRNIYFEVTDQVRLAENTGPFDPKGYGYLQRKAITLNLRDVSGSFKPYVHTQLVDIVLKTPPNSRITPWTVSHESIGERPMYGEGLFAIQQLPNRNVIKIDSGVTTQADWITLVYGSTYPLLDRFKELNAPLPTHFEVIYGSNKIIVPIADWNQPIVMPADLPLYSTVLLRFFKRTAVNDMQLSVAAMLVTQ